MSELKLKAPPVHYTTETLAERLNCAPYTVRLNWRRWGLRGMRFGRGYIFPPAEVEALERRRLSRNLTAAE